MALGADGNITPIVFMEFSVAGLSIDIIQELSAVLTPEQVAIDGGDQSSKSRQTLSCYR